MTPAEQLEQAREALLDFAFVVLTELGLVSWVERRGGQLRPWALKRRQRSST